MAKILESMLAAVREDREKFASEDGELNKIAGITSDEAKQSDGNWIADLGLDNPKIVEILRALRANLLLIEPTLRFVQLKQAEINRASLVVLYGEEEVQRRINALRGEESAKEELVG